MSSLDLTRKTSVESKNEKIVLSHGFNLLHVAPNHGDEKNGFDIELNTFPKTLSIRSPTDIRA